MKEDKSRSAFPIVGDYQKIYADGLTKREYIAAHAIKAVIISKSNGIVMYSKEKIAADAVKYTDALLKELEK